MDHDVLKLNTEEAAPYPDEDSPTKLRFDDLSRMDYDALEPMVKATLPCVDEDSAGKWRLDAEVPKERYNVETSFEKTILYIYAITNSIPVTSYRYMGFLLELTTNTQHCALECGFEPHAALTVLPSHRTHVFQSSQ